jgi:hypothetical protein
MNVARASMQTWTTPVLAEVSTTQWLKLQTMQGGTTLDIAWADPSMLSLPLWPQPQKTPDSA